MPTLLVVDDEPSILYFFSQAFAEPKTKARKSPRETALSESSGSDGRCVTASRIARQVPRDTSDWLDCGTLGRTPLSAESEQSEFTVSLQKPSNLRSGAGRTVVAEGCNEHSTVEAL